MNCESMYIYYDGQLNDCSSTCNLKTDNITRTFVGEPRIQHTTIIFCKIKKKYTVIFIKKKQIDILSTNIKCKIHNCAFYHGVSPRTNQLLIVVLKLNVSRFWLEIRCICPSWEFPIFVMSIILDGVRINQLYLSMGTIQGLFISIWFKM